MSASAGLRVGVAGCGYWGSKHVRALRALDSVERVTVIDPSPDRHTALERHFPGLGWATQLSEALPDIDALVIATPPSTHAGLALEAIAAGKHVLVEKPLATSVVDARTMVEAAQAGGVVLMVGHTFEYHSAVWSLRDMVREGRLGRLYYMHTARLNLGLYQHDVNVIFDLAPHDISILNYVLGGQPSAVECWASRHAHKRLEDVAYLRLHYEDSDVVANVHVSWLDPCKVRRVTMVGSEKMVVFDDLAPDERVRVHDKGVAPALTEGDLTKPPMSYRYGDVVAPYLVVNEPLALEDEHFVDCALTGMRPTTDGLNGLRVVEVLEAAQQSSQTRRAVRLSEVRDGVPSPPGVGLPRQAVPSTVERVR
jgi:predicted dehydrogenase